MSGGGPQERAVHWLLYLPNFGTGGTERQFALLAAGLAARGDRVTIAAHTAEGQHWAALTAAGQVEGALVRGTADLRRLVRAVRPDVLYSAMHLANLRARWAVTSTDTCLVWGIRAGTPRFNRKTTVVARLCALVSNGVPVLVANSALGLQAHLDYGYRPGRALVVDNGTDPEQFRPARDAAERTAARDALGVPEDALVVGCVARMEAVKRHDLLLAAWARVEAEQDNAWLVLVGGGDPTRSAALAASARQQGLQRVRLLGSRDDVPLLYRGMDLHVLASDSEGFPNAVVEAMASGLPNLATRAGDTARVLGEVGVAVPCGDLDALADGLLRLARDDGLRAELGQGARARVLEQFSVTAMVEATRQAVLGAAGDPPC